MTNEFSGVLRSGESSSLRLLLEFTALHAQEMGRSKVVGTRQNRKARFHNLKDRADDCEEVRPIHAAIRRSSRLISRTIGHSSAR